MNDSGLAGSRDKPAARRVCFFRLNSLRFLFALVVLAIIAQAAAGLFAAEPRLIIEGSQDLGEIYQFSRTDAVVYGTNESDETIDVRGVDQAEKNGIHLKHPVAIAPHSSEPIALEVDAGNRLGVVHFDGALETKPAVVGTAIVGFNAFVRSVLSDERPIIDFGVVNAGTEETKIFTLASDQLQDLRATHIDEVGAGFDARILEEGRALSVHIEPDARWGTHLDYLKVRLNSIEQPALWIRLMADVHGDIVPSLNPVDFSVVRQDSGAEEAVMLESRSGGIVDVERVEVEGAELSHATQPCQGRKDCVVLKLRLKDTQPPGQIFARAYVRFKHRDDVLPIGIRGLVLGKNQRVIDLTEKVQGGGTSNLRPKRLSDELEKATEPRVVPSVPAGRGPLLKWSVENEGGVYGYAIYRSAAQEGPFLRVNAETIKVMDDGDSHDYQWRDTAAKPGEVYWYYVGLIFKDGHKTRLTQPQRVEAK